MEELDNINEEIQLWSDNQIIKYLKDHWKCNEFVFEGEVVEERKNTTKYFGQLRNIKLDGRKIEYPDGTKIFFKIPIQLGKDLQIGGNYRFKCTSLADSDFRKQIGNYYLLRPNFNSIEKVNYIITNSPNTPYSYENKKIIEHLRIRWGINYDNNQESFRIIGQFFIIEDLKFKVEDIRDIDFAKLSTYADGVPIEDIYTTLPSTNYQLPNDGEYYEFYLKPTHNNPENPFEITVDVSKPFSLVSSRGIVNRIYDSIYKAPLSSRKRDASMLDTLKNQLTQSGKEVFIYELLQNANDYPVSKGQKVDIEFHLTDNYLIFQHTGANFSARNFAAICTINDRDKTANKETIGYKGIGFKTVFLLNDYVYLQSADYRIRFDRKHSRNVEAMPWQILPVWTDSIDKQVHSVFQKSSSDFRVKVAFRPINKDTISLFDSIFRSTFSSERDILFIPNINSVKVIFEDNTSIIQNKNVSSWIVSNADDIDYIENISPEVIESINEEIRRGESEGSSKIPPKYYDFSKTSFSFACRKKGDAIEPIENAHLYCYLPTKANFGFKFLLNSDMIPNGPRDNIEPIELNYQLAEIAGRKFFRWIKNLMKERKYDLGSIFKLIPDFNKCIREHNLYEEFILRFKNGFEECLEKESFIPVHDGFSLLKNVLCDKTNITTSGIFTDNEFISFTSDEYQLPLPIIRDNTDFKHFLQRYAIDDQCFTEHELLDLCDNNDFQEWLLKQENNNNFLGYIIDQNYLSNIYQNDKTIYISHNGSLYRSDDLFYDISDYLVDLECFSDALPRLSTATCELLNKNKKWSNDDIEYNFRKFEVKEILEELLKKDISEIDYLGTKENSIHFLHFLAIHYDEGRNIFKDYSIPFFNTNDELVESFDNKLVFYNSPEESIIKSQSWISKDWVEFISDDYFQKDKDQLSKILDFAGVTHFTHERIINDIINNKSYKYKIINNLITPDACISFAKYTYNHKEEFHDKQLEEFNLLLYNSDGNIVFGTADNDAFFNSNLYKTLLEQPWINSSWLWSLSDEYFKGVNVERFKQFLTSRFGVREISTEIFFNDIVLSHDSEIKEQLENFENNICFWRWIKNNVPMYANNIKDWWVIANDDNNGVYHYFPTDVYLSNDYLSDGNGIESIIKKYYTASIFIVPDYLEDKLDTTKKNWREFFKSIGVKSSITELLFTNIIPNLSNLEDESLPALLAQERENLKAEWNTILPKFHYLKLRINNLTYKSLIECKFINCSSNELEPFKSLIIQEEYYLKICSSDVRRLLLDIADSIPNNKNIIQNLSDWRKEKLNTYLILQEKSRISKELHFQIIRELLLLDDYAKQELKEYTDKILLLSVNNEWKQPKELTLGTIYQPLCDFEANGIGYDKLIYLSNEYGADIRKPLREVFNKLHRNFEKEDVQLLSNFKFATYFWCHYLFEENNPNKYNNQSHIKAILKDNLFKKIPCIPTIDGVRSAEELYDTSLIDYLKNIDGSESKFPSIELRDIIKKNSKFFDEDFEFKTHLDFNDCLDALLVRNSKEYRDTITYWLNNTYENAIFDEQIDNYLSREEALWKNGLGRIIHISKLHVVDPGDITLHSLFCQDEFVLDDSYIRSSCINEVCDILKIPFITIENGVDIKPHNWTNQSDYLTSLFIPRLLLIAASESQSEFADKFEQYKDSLLELKYYACEKISLSFKINPGISRNAKQFYFNSRENKIYYVGEWNSRRVFKDIVTSIIDKLCISLSIDQVEEIFDLEENECIGFIEDHFAKLLIDESFNNLLEKYFLNIASKVNKEIYNPSNEEESPNRIISSTDSNKTPYDSSPEVTDEYPKEPDYNNDQEETTSINSNDGISQNKKNNNGFGIETSSKELFSNQINAPLATHPVWKPRPRQEKNDDIVELNRHLQSNSVINRQFNTEDYKPSEPRKPITDWKTDENTPELRVADASEAEIDAVRNLLNRSKTEEEIVDEQYLTRWRMYQALIAKGINLGDEKTFVNSHNQEIETCDGGYIYTRSAKGGILYVSAYLWEKLETNSGRLCLYYGNKAYDFELIDGIDQLINYVGKDNIIIQIKGPDKLQAIKNVFNGQVDTLNTHALIRIKSNERYNSLFLDTNTNNDSNNSDF